MEKNYSEKTVWFGKIATYHASPLHQKVIPPIVFIHGAWGGKKQFKKWLYYCEAHGFNAYALDLPGHHQSPGNLVNFSIKDYVSVVEQFIQQIGPCYLVGHSMGGLIAQTVASQVRIIKKAVFVASAPPAGFPFLNSFIISLSKYLPVTLRRQPLLLTRADASRFLFDRCSPNSYESLVPESSRAALEVILGRIWIKHISCPTLVIAAECDRLFPTRIERKTAHKYGSEYLELQNMGHMVMLEPEWEYPITKILQWLEA